jgi:hypothetical protein
VQYLKVVVDSGVGDCEVDALVTRLLTLTRFVDVDV